MSVSKPTEACLYADGWPEKALAGPAPAPEPQLWRNLYLQMRFPPHIWEASCGEAGVAVRKELARVAMQCAMCDPGQGFLQPHSRIICFSLLPAVLLWADEQLQQLIYVVGTKLPQPHILGPWMFPIVEPSRTGFHHFDCGRLNEGHRNLSTKSLQILSTHSGSEYVMVPQYINMAVMRVLIITEINLTSTTTASGNSKCYGTSFLQTKGDKKLKLEMQAIKKQALWRENQG